jgi:hypothetical protein
MEAPEGTGRDCDTSTFRRQRPGLLDRTKKEGQNLVEFLMTELNMDVHEFLGAPEEVLATPSGPLRATEQSLLQEIGTVIVLR